MLVTNNGGGGVNVGSSNVFNEVYINGATRGVILHGDKAARASNVEQAERKSDLERKITAFICLPP